MQQKKNKNLKTSVGWLRKSSKEKGFTLIEILIVVILITIIAVFGIPGYGKMIRRSHERNAILGLIAINQANAAFEAKNGTFWVGGPIGLAAINTNLSIELKALDLTYSYTGAAGLYAATAAWTGANPFTVGVDESPISLGANPFCSAGPCPSLP